MELIKVLFFVIIVLVIGNVTLTNRTVDESILVADLTAEISAIQNNNTILRAEVASAGSIGNLSARIESAGFTANPEIVVIDNPSSVALR